MKYSDQIHSGNWSFLWLFIGTFPKTTNVRVSMNFFLINWVKNIRFSSVLCPVPLIHVLFQVPCNLKTLDRWHTHWTIFVLFFFIKIKMIWPYTYYRARWHFFQKHYNCSAHLNISVKPYKNNLNWIYFHKMKWNSIFTVRSTLSFDFRVFSGSDVDYFCLYSVWVFVRLRLRSLKMGFPVWKIRIQTVFLQQNALVLRFTIRSVFDTFASFAIMNEFHFPGRESSIDCAER